MVTHIELILFYFCSLFPTMSQIAAMPTVIAFHNGKVVDKFTGLRDNDQLDAFVAKLTKD